MRLLIILGAFFLLTGCMPPSQDQLRMEMDLAEMKRRLAKLEVQKAEESSSEQRGSDTLQRQVAEIQAGLDTLRVDFQSINGRLDDLGHDNQQLSDELQLIKDDVGLQFSSVNDRLSSLEERAAQQPAGTTVAAPAAAPDEKAAATAPAETPEQLYQRALDLIRKDGKYAEGRKLLETFIAKYPEHELKVNALYWCGEALYGEKKYELAILKLQDVISGYPNHPKAPAAMLKQALAFDALGDQANAKTTMQKLIETYPDSDQVAAAKAFLAE